MAHHGWKTQCSNGTSEEHHFAFVVSSSHYNRCFLYITQNQTNNLDKSIDDVLEHFVYLPKQSTANPQDIPFFLSTRLADAAGGETAQVEPEDIFGNKDPVQVVARYENRAAELAAEYEENMVRF